MKYKKAQLGLGTVKAVMIMFLILAVLAVSILLVLPLIRDVTEDVDRTSVSITNITTDSTVNETGAYVSGTSGLLNCVLSVTSAINQTGSVWIASGNYTTSTCKILCDGCDAGYNNTLWNVTGSYTYSEATSRELTGNVTTGIKDFFNNTGTIFAILVVVVIILAIAIIIAVVSRFGGGEGRVSGGLGRRREYGSETVMGV